MQRIWIILVMFVVMSPLLLFADINEDLIEAAKNGRTDEVRNLLDAGADVNVMSEIGTAMDMALAREHDDIVELLKQAGAKE